MTCSVFLAASLCLYLPDVIYVMSSAYAMYVVFGSGSGMSFVYRV